jgi:hypothetical protein
MGETCCQSSKDFSDELPGSDHDALIAMPMPLGQALTDRSRISLILYVSFVSRINILLKTGGSLAKSTRRFSWRANDA